MADWKLPALLTALAAGAWGAREVQMVKNEMRQRRQQALGAASQRARLQSKPMLVLQPADTMVSVAALGGDPVAVKAIISGPGGETEHTMETSSAVELLETMGDDTHVIVADCVLERAEDIEGLGRQLERVGGQDVFCVTVTTNSFRAFVAPGARRRIHSAPSGDGAEIVHEPLPSLMVTAGDKDAKRSA